MTTQPDPATMAAARDAFTPWAQRNQVGDQEVWTTFRDGFLAGAQHAETVDAEAGREPAGAAR